MRYILLLTMVWFGGFLQNFAIAAERPNIVIILVDDMGFSDLGCYGSEIETPHIDGLAAGGLQFMQFYNAGRCCPTRASLMTGLHPHQVGIGHMTEPPDRPLGFEGAYQGHLNDRCTTIASVLKSAGYHTLMTGKWHLGYHEKADWPLQRGFDRFYGGLSGAYNYFKPEGDRGLTFGNDPIEAPADFYATDTLTGEVATLPREGTLLPETYQYIRGDSRQSLINRMVRAMDTAVQGLWATRHPEFPLKSIEEVLTLASIIEKETGVAAERPQVASVFFNRLETGMRLQSDPTVIYALTQGKQPLGRQLLTKDLEQTTSKYNTYMYAGLPPGPIANPGLASLQAVFAPAKTPYFYFVADGTGGHAFAETLDQHNRNVAKWRGIQRASRAAAKNSKEP